MTVSDDETARVWDLQTSEALGVLEGHTLAVRDLTVDARDLFGSVFHRFSSVFIDFKRSKRS